MVRRRVPQTLAGLEEETRKRNQKIKEFHSTHYRLAKLLGFSAVEAGILQNWTEETIRRLAQEREHGKKTTD